MIVFRPFKMMWCLGLVIALAYNYDGGAAFLGFLLCIDVEFK
tara:strand:+ start:20491 stop:20616 length:126 start_codon:yes stop_codon:yes gene_type:complete